MSDPIIKRIALLILAVIIAFTAFFSFVTSSSAAAGVLPVLGAEAFEILLAWLGMEAAAYLNSMGYSGDVIDEAVTSGFVGFNDGFVANMELTETMGDVVEAMPHIFYGLKQQIEHYAEMGEILGVAVAEGYNIVMKKDICV